MGDFPWQKGPDEDRDRWGSSRMPWQRESDDLVAPKEESSTEPRDRAADAGAADPDPRPVSGPSVPDPGSEPQPDLEPGPVPEPEPLPEPPQPDSEPEPDLAVSMPAVDKTTRAAKPSQAAAAPHTAKRDGRAKPGARIGAVIVVLLAGGGVVAGFANASGDGDDAPSYELTAEEESELTAEVANTVLGFFDGVVARDAEQALAYVDPDDIEGASAALLTDEVLAASQERAPIENVSVTNIEIDPDYRFHATADAEYLLDGEQTTTSIDVWEESSSDTGWSVRVDDRALMFSTPTFDDLRPVVYGAEVALDVRTPLFPGVYEVAFAEAPHLSLVEMSGIEAGTSVDDGSDVAVLTHPLGDESYIDLGVSRAGRAAYVDAVMAGIDTCVASTSAENPCAQSGGSAAGRGATDGTVARTLDEELSDLDLDPRPLLDDSMKLRGIVLIAAKYEATCEDGERCSGTEYFDYPVVEFGSGSPRVTWEAVDSSS